jgi:hypothetical protein
MSIPGGGGRQLVVVDSTASAVFVTRSVVGSGTSGICKLIIFLDLLTTLACTRDTQKWR